MRRVTIALVVFAVALGTTLVATGATRGEPEPGSRDHLFIRWDLVQFQANLVLAGGSNISTDMASGDTIKLTGSGQAEPREEEAAGGGTFVHRHDDGSLVGRGAYQVTGFLGWHRITGGSLASTGLSDGIGNGTGAQVDENEETSGVLTLRVRFLRVTSGEPQGVNGVLIVYCHLPGSTEDVPEGVRVMVPAFDLDFRPTEGFTLLHRLQ
jgi:hypothetical protein